ncbi:hypothetical protein [Halopiger goleimassiliensis]|uniref:hypothetical protein n=1 Tax=Halopiger goleimassiliensis TaxID=1293048 RepID=UPI0006780D7D|nr:hypothetical protein [Halopiger goleimassiliensis]
MSDSRSSDKTFFLGVVSLLVACIVLVPSYLVMIGGVASTIAGWIPQPSLGTLVLAFQLYLVASICLLPITVDLSLEGLPSVRDVVVSAGIVAVVVVPLLYLLVHAAVSVWTALPDSYEAQASFLFLLASLIGHVTANSDD